MTTRTHDLPAIRLTPSGSRRRGDLVTSSWTLSNLGDVDIARAHLIVVASPGLIPQLDLSTLPGKRHTRLIARPLDADQASGMPLPKLAPGATLPLAVVFRIDDDTADLSIQARVLLPNMPPACSPIAVVPIRSHGKTDVDLVATAGTSNPDSVNVTISFRNPGGLSDTVRVLFPVPPCLNLVEVKLPQDGEQHKDLDKLGFTVNLAPHSEARIELALRANDRLYGDIVEFLGVLVASETIGTFPLDPVVVFLQPAPEVVGDCYVGTHDTNVVNAGELTDVTVVVQNLGRSIARDVAVSMQLPEELLYCPGSLVVNGVAQGLSIDPTTIALALLPPRSIATVVCRAVVKMPSTNGTPCVVRATLNDKWLQPCYLTIGAQPHFSTRQNYVWSDTSRSIKPDHTTVVHVHVQNCGSDRAQSVRLRVDAGGLGLTEATCRRDDSIRIVPRHNREGTLLDLGPLDAGDERDIALTFLAPETFADNTQFPVSIALRVDTSPELNLGGIVFVGVSRANLVPNSRLMSQRSGPIRVGDRRVCSIILCNAGSDLAQDVRVNLHLPESLALVAAEGARYTGHVVSFDTIPAQATAQATITLELLSAAAGEERLDIHPSVSGDQMRSFELPPLFIDTLSHGYIDGATIELVARGNEFQIKVHLRNIGDGPADNVRVTIPKMQGYVRGSTTVNGNVLRDVRTRSAFSYGFTLPSIAPNEELELFWSLTGHHGAREIDASAQIEYDGQPPIDLRVCQSSTPVRPRFLAQYENDAARLLYHDGTFADLTLSSDDRPALDAGAPPSLSYIEDEGRNNSLRQDLDELANASPELTAALDRARNAETMRSPIAAPESDHLVTSQGNGATETRPSSNRQLADDALDSSPNEASTPLPGGADASDIQSADTNPNTAHDSYLTIAGPIGIATLDPVKLERLRTVVDRLNACPTIGWFRHVFVMRLLIPDQLMGVSEDANDAWSVILAAVSNGFGAPLVQTILPSFIPTIPWMMQLTNDVAGQAVECLLRTIPEAVDTPTSYRIDPWAPNELYTSIDRSLYDYLDPNDKGDLAHLNALLASMMVDTGGTPQLQGVLTTYKTLLRNVFDSFAYAGAETQLRTMVGDRNVDLDNALDGVLAVLP